MGKETKIEWCDSTVNPTDFQCCGCELWNKSVNYCYAGRFAERRAGKGAFDKPVVLKPGRMAEAARWSDLTDVWREDKPWLNNRPRIIFIGDMADVFQPGVPFGFIYDEIYTVVRSMLGSRHIWMLLTKQPKRMVEFQNLLRERGDEWPKNLWPGVSITSERSTWRIDELVKIDSAHRFISYEPAFEYIDFSRWTCRPHIGEFGKETLPSEQIDLIITGGMSGVGAKQYPFNVKWARDLIDLGEFDQFNVFIKQLGSNPSCECGELPNPGFKHPKGGDWSEWPADLRVRQFPDL